MLTTMNKENGVPDEERLCCRSNIHALREQVDITTSVFLYDQGEVTVPMDSVTCAAMMHTPEKLQ
jgi:hypothetical protein